MSDDDAAALRVDGKKPGDREWENEGICKSVTWPRSKITILGQRDDGFKLVGEYITGKTKTIEKTRGFKHIGFVQSADLNSTAKKKQLVALIDGIFQSEVKKDSPFIVSEKSATTILFDELAAEDWLLALQDAEHVTDFFIVADKKSTFDSLKARVIELLGPILTTEDERRPMSDGFSANVEYFRLDFLDKDYVALGRQFREILPILWLRAGAIGPRPELAGNKPLPDSVIPDRNTFAVLRNEKKFSTFIRQISKRKDLTHVFLVTDSEEAFQDMASRIDTPNVVQLYRDYLENFVINKGGKS